MKIYRSFNRRSTSPLKGSKFAPYISGVSSGLIVGLLSIGMREALPLIFMVMIVAPIILSIIPAGGIYAGTVS